MFNEFKSSLKKMKEFHLWKSAFESTRWVLFSCFYVCLWLFISCFFTPDKLQHYRVIWKITRIKFLRHRYYFMWKQFFTPAKYFYNYIYFFRLLFLNKFRLNWKKEKYFVYPKAEAFIFQPHLSKWLILQKFIFSLFVSI